MLSLVASASTLVLEVMGACTQTNLLRSPVSMTLQLVTGVTLPLEQFDIICRPHHLMHTLQAYWIWLTFCQEHSDWLLLSVGKSVTKILSCLKSLLGRSDLGSGFSTLIAGTIVIVIAQVLIMVTLSFSSCNGFSQLVNLKPGNTKVELHKDFAGVFISECQISKCEWKSSALEGINIVCVLRPYLSPREKWSSDYGAASDAAAWFYASPIQW